MSSFEQKEPNLLTLSFLGTEKYSLKFKENAIHDDRYVLYFKYIPKNSGIISHIQMFLQ